MNLYSTDNYRIDNTKIDYFDIYMKKGMIRTCITCDSPVKPISYKNPNYTYFLNGELSRPNLDCLQPTNISLIPEDTNMCSYYLLYCKKCNLEYNHSKFFKPCLTTISNFFEFFYYKYIDGNLDKGLRE